MLVPCSPLGISALFYSFLWMEDGNNCQLVTPIDSMGFDFETSMNFCTRASTDGANPRGFCLRFLLKKNGLEKGSHTKALDTN
jgi:hypothetical protein